MTVCMSQRSSIHVIVVVCIFDPFAVVDQGGLWCMVLTVNGGTYMYMYGLVLMRVDLKN